MKSFKELLASIGRFQVQRPYLTLFIILAITIIFYGGATQVRTVASLEQMMPEQIEEIKAFNTLRDNALGQDMIAVIIQLDKNSPSEFSVMDVQDKIVMESAELIAETLRSQPDILQVYAASDVISYASKSSVNALDEQTYTFLLSHEQVESQLTNFINEDRSIMIILATTDVSADDVRMQQLASSILSIVDSAQKPTGIEIKVTGTPIIQQKLGELIAKDRVNTQRISTLFVFLIIMFLFGTFTSALVPIIVVTLSVQWLYGIMGYAGLPISTLAGGVAAMVIGIGIDYAIHLMNRFKNERKKGLSVEDAIVEAVQNTGTALTGAAIATTLAFLAFLVGAMPEMNRFGLLMAIGVSSAFLLSIFALPALLVIEERIIHRLAKRLRFGVEGEYLLCNRDEVHPDDHEVVEPSKEDLQTIAQKYKIIKKKRGGRT